VVAATREDIHQAIAALQLLVELFQRRRVHLAAAVDLTEHQWSVLEEISTEHFMPSMFARQRESSAAAISKTLRQLSDKELIASSAQESDGRKRHYQLTEKGKRTMQRLRQQRQEAIELVWADFDSATLHGFVAFSEQLTSKLNALLGPGRAKS
jgi:DNA-binding MarR family transcriptional regulator